MNSILFVLACCVALIFATPGDITPKSSPFSLSQSVTRDRVEMCGISSSDFITYYVENGASSGSVKAVVSNSSGTFGNFAVTTSGSESAVKQVSAGCFRDTDKASVVVWVESSGSNYNIYGQVSKPDGSVVVSKTLIAQESGTVPKAFVKEMDTTRAVIVWTSSGSNGVVYVKGCVMSLPSGSLSSTVTLASNSYPGPYKYDFPSAAIVGSDEMLLCWTFGGDYSMWCKSSNFGMSSIGSQIKVRQGLALWQSPMRAIMISLASGKSVAVYRNNQWIREDIWATFMSSSNVPDSNPKFIDVNGVETFSDTSEYVATDSISGGNYFVTSWLDYDMKTVLTRTLKEDKSYFGDITNTITESSNYITAIVTCSVSGNMFSIGWVKDTGSNTFELSAQVFELVVV